MPRLYTQVLPYMSIDIDVGIMVQTLTTVVAEIMLPLSGSLHDQKIPIFSIFLVSMVLNTLFLAWEVLYQIIFKTRL